MLLKYKLITRINGKQVDLAFARSVDEANKIIVTIIKHGYGVYDAKNVRKVSFTIRRLK